MRAAATTAPAGLASAASTVELFELDGRRYERRSLLCWMRRTPFILEVIRELADALAEANTERRRSVNSADETLVAMAHELRGRLHVLTLNSDCLLCAADPSEPEPPRAWLLERLKRLDRGLRAMAELMEGVLEVQRRPLAQARRRHLDLRALVMALMHTDGDALRSARCSCELVAPIAVSGPWDPLQLRIAIGNLINNAVKFGAGRPITVEVGARDRIASVRVADRGPGLHPDDFERIFERFERASGSESVGGWGVGLWIVRKIARAYGGDVTVRSAPGEGAEFTLSLPQGRTYVDTNV